MLPDPPRPRASCPRLSCQSPARLTGVPGGGGGRWRIQAAWCPGARPPPGEGTGLCRGLVSSVARRCFHAGCETQGTWASLHVGDPVTPVAWGGRGRGSARQAGLSLAGAACGALRTCGPHTLTVSWRAFSIQSRHHFHVLTTSRREHTASGLLGRLDEAPQGSGPAPASPSSSDLEAVPRCHH